MIRRSNPRITTPVEYPDGVFVDAEEHTYYIRGRRRYRLYSKRCLESWSAKPILGSEKSLSNVPKAKSPLGFRDGTLIHNYADGRLYLVSGNKRRQITSPDVLGRYGWKPGDAIIVSEQETNLHEEGEALT